MVEYVNIDNLIKNTDRTPMERRQNAKKAGIASGKARRRKKKMREIFLDIAYLPLSDKKLKAKMLANGITEEDTSNVAAIIFVTFLKALAGNERCLRLIAEMLGELPEIKLKEKELKLKERQIKGEEQEAITVKIACAEDNLDGNNKKN